MRIITLEEHFASPAFLAGPGKEFNFALRNRGARGVKISDQLRDVGDQRVLGEINVSSVFPIPDEAPAEIARRVAHRLRSEYSDSRHSAADSAVRSVNRE